MKDFTTWVFIGNNETDVNVEIYKDGRYKVKEITIYDFNTGNPCNIEEVPKDKEAELERKVNEEYGRLLSMGYFGYTKPDDMELSHNASEDSLTGKFLGEF